MDIAVNHEMDDASVPGGGKREARRRAGWGTSLRRLLPPYVSKSPAEVARQHRQVFGWMAPLGRLLPPYQDRPPEPQGFVGFPHAWKEVYLRAGSWGVLLGWTDISLRTTVAERLGQAAAGGEIEIAGADARTGDIYWLPREVWLTTVLAGGRVSSPAHFASRGGLVRLPSPHADVLCRPLVSLHDLAIVMGALDPPPRPGPGLLATVALNSSKHRSGDVSSHF